MKITLDLKELLDDGKITQAEFEKFSALAATSTGSLAFNILIGFGVIAVSAATLALAPRPSTAIAIGLVAMLVGLAILRRESDQWTVLANIFMLVGALMSGGGIIAAAQGNLASILAVTALFAVAGVFARSALLVVLATLMLSASIGAKTGYFHASYFLVIKEPTITIGLFLLVGVGLYQLSKRLPAAFERLAIASARTCVFLVNFGFWVGSLWGERADSREVIVSDSVFAIAWAIALIVAAIWSWRSNRRWVLNTVATFGGIHLYTQWFEHLGASPGTILIAGILALVFALALKNINKTMKENV